MKTIESTGIVDERHQIELDEPLNLGASVRVRVTIEYDENESELAKQLEIGERVMAENEAVFRELAK